MHVTFRSLAACALCLAAVSCKTESDSPAAIDLAAADSGSRSSVIVVLADAGIDAVKAAERAVQGQVNHRDMPKVRLDLVADLLANSLLGSAPGDPIAPLLNKLGEPEKKGEVWRWPGWGIEAVVQGDRLQRIALHAALRADDPSMKIFVGEVLVGPVALTEKAPDLHIKQVAQALGIGDARGQMDANVSELGWRRGDGALFLTFDNDTLALEAIVLERFQPAIWNAMQPLDSARQIWEVEPLDVSSERKKARIGFAPVPEEIRDGEVMKMRLVEGREPRGKQFFDELQAQFLAGGESLRRVHGGRVAMLRASDCSYLVVERKDGTWEARNPSSLCSREDEAKGLERLKQQFAVNKK